MKTKTIFKMLALAMMMPAMMLTTACSSDDNAVENENNKKGYAIPVTVNVTRQGDGTRTTYNETTRKLEFSAGDQLFVHGLHVTDNTPNRFGGFLTWVSEGTFTGTIVTKLPYTGTANDLFSSANTVAATLLPNDYEDYGYFFVTKNYTFNASYSLVWSGAVATSTDLETAKALAVEQFSFETTIEYDNGFTLSPGNAILNFTITGLTANADVTVNITVEESPMITNKVVTTDGSGNATFAIGVEGGWNLNDIALTVDGNAITLVNSSKPLVEGHVYNITRSAAPAYKLASEATASDYGKVVCNNGHLHDAKTAVTGDCTAVAVFGYISGSDRYAIALQDAASATWNAITNSGDNAGTNCAWTWTVAKPDGANWYVATQPIYSGIFQALGSSNSYNATSNAFITTNVGGTALSDSYWTTTEYSGMHGRTFEDGRLWQLGKSNSNKVRPVLKF